MKKLEYNKGYIYVNKLNGSAGHEILLPDNADLYVWAKCSQSDYDKWFDKSNQKLIEEEIISTLAITPILLDENGNNITNIENLNINFSDNVYSFSNLMKDNNINLFRNVDLLNKEHLLNKNNN